MTHPFRSRAAALVVALAGLMPMAPSAARAAGDAVAVPFDSPRWRLDANEARAEPHLGRPSLRLRGGGAWLADAGFADGVIEFDVAFGPERGFGGVAWRVRGEGDFEHFYLRPHQSAKPDSLQYTPEFHGVSGWQLYHGEGYGAAVSFPYHEWIHVRIVVSGGRAEAYVDSEEPVLFMHDLKREPGAGGLALVVGNFAPVHFSNFTYRALESPELRGEAPAPRPAPDGTVRSWSVSSAFDGARLDGRFALEAADTAGLEWHPLDAEDSGVANLARVQGVRPGADTAFVRLTLRADGARSVLLRFGYSDRVRVYLDGALLYSGDNGYQSRDFRYLGTIGLFDALPLRLDEGDNELLLAVSESFGGWGVQAAVAGGEGVRIVARP